MISWLVVSNIFFHNIWNNPSHWLIYLQDGWNHQPVVVFVISTGEITRKNITESRPGHPACSSLPLDTSPHTGRALLAPGTSCMGGDQDLTRKTIVEWSWRLIINHGLILWVYTKGDNKNQDVGKIGTSWCPHNFSMPLERRTRETSSVITGRHGTSP